MIPDIFNINWSEFTFRYPWVLILLLLVPYLFYIQSRKSKNDGSISFSTLAGLKSARSWKTELLRILPYFTPIAIAFIIIALAGPVEQDSSEWVESNGYDIMICLDVSSSMLVEDFKPNRLEVTKALSKDFIEKRKGSRIGLVEFAGESYLRVPLTTDYALLESELAKVKSFELKDGTDIGDAIVTAIDRIKDIPAKSKIIILMTDGEENSGHTDALTALDIAKPFGVKIYTIGVGSDTQQEIPVQTPSGKIEMRKVNSTLDEELLQQVAMESGGQYYRATDEESLQRIYDDIDKLEKSKIKSHSSLSQKDVFMPFAFIAILFLLLQWLLFYGVLKPKP